MREALGGVMTEGLSPPCAPVDLVVGGGARHVARVGRGELTAIAS